MTRFVRVYKNGEYTEREEQEDIGSDEHAEKHYVLVTTLPEVGEGFPSVSIFERSAGGDDTNPHFLCVLNTSFSWEPVVMDTHVDLYDFILRYLPLFGPVLFPVFYK